MHKEMSVVLQLILRAGAECLIEAFFICPTFPIVALLDVMLQAKRVMHTRMLETLPVLAISAVKDFTHNAYQTLGCSGR